MKKVGKNIKMYRIRKGISQSDLARFLFVSKSTVSNWESGRFSPSISKIRRIAEFLDVDANEIINAEPVETKREVLSFGEALKAARKLKGLTQGAVSLSIGVSQSTIASWENETASPSFEKIRELCLLYDISACEILGLVCFQEDSNLFHLIKDYDNLSDEGKNKILAYMEDMTVIYKV